MPLSSFAQKLLTSRFQKPWTIQPSTLFPKNTLISNVSDPWFNKLTLSFKLCSVNLIEPQA
jgi:hypothetical protein